MGQLVKVRRCAVLLIDPREDVCFDLDDLLGGGAGLRTDKQLLALAPHLGEEVSISAEEAIVLMDAPVVAWVSKTELEARFGQLAVDTLLLKGLLLSDENPASPLRARDDLMRETYWWAPAAVAHYMGRWKGVVSVEGSRRHGFRTMSQLAETLGPPPPHVTRRVPLERSLSLPQASDGSFEELLDRRVTCRNYEITSALPLLVLARLLQRVFFARGSVAVTPETVVLKRSSPSGGGLHPVEAYLLVQNVEAVSPGLYHYHPLDHALEPLQEMAAGALRERALRAVAGQEYYAEAHVLVVLVGRFRRNYWKYRRHTKAYRVVTLDAGHLSQTLYLSATEMGMGAFITAAINEVDIEEMFGLDPLVESPLAICGFGWRASERQTVEFDPLGAVWQGGTG